MALSEITTVYCLLIFMTTTEDILESQANGHSRIAAGEIYDVAIEKLVYGGDGFAHIGSQAVFVPFAAVGDQLRVRITEVERNYARGVIEEILHASADRRTPPCPHFGVCGGCQLQHLSYAAQLNAKVAFVRESLRRLGCIDWDGEIATRSADEFGYRSRAELKIARDEFGKARIGYYRPASQRVCEVESCLILMPAANRELQRLHAEPSLIPNDATRVHFTVGDTEVIVTPATGENGKSEAVDALGTAYQRIAGFNYGFGVRSFFQGNRLLVEDLVHTAIGDAKGKLAVDLYAGVGLFSLQLAKTFEQVVAVEGNRPAASHGMENVRSNNLPNVRYEQLSVEAWLKYKSVELPCPDFVLLDPPRSGAGAQVIERLVAMAAPQMAYVSCDPATLARDLRLLVNYGYSIESITALDMFPQTYHVETVVRLRIAD
ncbi:MAG: class I SAM-dependent RNA methyltransferase [Acidobacteria bacterium]|nr:class I SAM-dependent RNA methyltransferase [Acidobacteriota bacterium]